MLKTAIIIMCILSQCTAYQLPPCTDGSEIEKIEEMVGTHHFKYIPTIDIFDCSDMSIANWHLLNDSGYKPFIAMAYENMSHCYVVCRAGNGWIGIDNLGNPDIRTHTGRVTTDLEVFQLLTPAELIAIDGEPIIKGDVLIENPSYSLPKIFL